MNNFKRLLEAKKMSGLDALTKAFALMKYSGRMTAGLRIEQRFYDSWMKKKEAFEKKHFNGDLMSPENMLGLERAADKWWNNKAMKGPSVDW